MTKPTPQQILLLELLMASGDIAIGDDKDGTTLGRTLKECRDAGWILVHEIAPGFNKVRLAKNGRDAILSEPGSSEFH